MLIDANLLLYAVDRLSPFHRRAAEWLEAAVNGTTRVGIAWTSLLAFLRIVTHPRALDRPLAPAAAWEFVADWLAAPRVWVPQPTDRTAEILGHLVTTYQLRANLVPDAWLAALAIENGLAVCSADTDFARFREVRWINPLAA
jgi:hypothetical protein